MEVLFYIPLYKHKKIVGWTISPLGKLWRNL